MSAPRLSPVAAWLLALTATATMTVSYVDRQAMAVLAPTLTRALHMSEAQFGWVGAAFSIAYLVGAPLGGRFIQRVGARDGLILAVLAWSLVSAAHALVPGVASLFLLRILLGLCEAPSFPAAAQTVTRALPGRDRDAAFGILFTGSSLGAMIAPPLATALAARWTWRGGLVGTALIGLAWLPLWLLASRGLAAREALAPRPEPGRAPFHWPSLLADPAVVRAVLAVLALSPTTCFLMIWSAKVLVARHGLPQEAIGRYLWVPPVFFDAGAVGIGALASLRERLAPSQKPHRALFAASLALAAVVAALGLARTPWATVAVLSTAFAGCGGMMALATADMMRRVHPSNAAPAGGVTAAAQSAAYVAASPLIGVAVDHGRSFAAVAVALGVLLLPGALAWLAWTPPPPHSGE